MTQFPFPSFFPAGARRVPLPADTADSFFLSAFGSG